MNGDKHTPGPWVIDYGETLGHIKSVPPGAGTGITPTPTVCLYDSVYRSDVISDAEAAANARLIAAAPDLLALARQYAAECGECNGSGVHEFVGTRTVPACCQRPNDDGSCCGNAVPESEPYAETEPCPDCIEIRQVIAKAVGQ